MNELTNDRLPDGLLEFVDGVYVLDSCFRTEVLPDGSYKKLLHEMVNSLHLKFPKSTFLALNFGEVEKRSVFAKVLSEHDITVLEYPQQYESCPLLPLSLIQNFLCESENWLARGNGEDAILLHCQRGGWPLLAFILASFQIFRNVVGNERRTLQNMHLKAPKGLLELLSPLNPFASQLRYLQYLSRRNIDPVWPPPERTLSLDCLIIRAVPSFDSQQGCRPFIRIFGRNSRTTSDLSTTMLYSMSRKKPLQHYTEEVCDELKIDIQCWVQGDVVLECVHLDLDPEQEVMMFRVMFNTAFIRSNILILNSDDLDIPWEAQSQYPKGFRAELLFGDVENISLTPLRSGDENRGLPIGAFPQPQPPPPLPPPPPPLPLRAKDSSALPSPPHAGSGRASRCFRRVRGASSPIAAPTKNMLKPLHWTKTNISVKGSLWDYAQERERLQQGCQLDVSEIENLFSQFFPQLSSPLVMVNPFCWSKITRVVQGSLWDDIRLHDNPSWVTELDVSEIKSLFSTVATPPPPPPKSKTSAPPTPLPPRYNTFAPRAPPPPPPYKTYVPPIRPPPLLPPPQYKKYVPLTHPTCLPPQDIICCFESCLQLPLRPAGMDTPPLFVVDLRRAINCEIMLTKIKIPLPDMLSAVLALDSSALDIDQVEKFIKFCPTKEEMEMLRNYTGDKEMLGKCEQFFMELMKVPRVEAKLRVFGFKITFASQVEELKSWLNTINAATKEVKESTKLRQIMQTILILRNALNQGTARGSALGFRLESLLKLSDTRATNSQMNLMHYLCKLIGEKVPELLDFVKDLVHLEAASKIELKTLAEEMQAVSKGLEKVEQELMTSENDGEISVGFRKVLKEFLDSAEAEVGSLISFYWEVGRNADSLPRYFGEDPVWCPFEQVTKILTLFMKTFIKSREENEKQADVEKKKLEKEKKKTATKKEGADADT